MVRTSTCINSQSNISSIKI